MERNCLNCSNYNYATCEFIKNGILVNARVLNMDNSQVTISKSILIKQEFAKILCCANYKLNEIMKGK